MKQTKQKTYKLFWNGCSTGIYKEKLLEVEDGVV